MQFKVVCCKLFGSLTLITFLLACANTTRSGAVGVNRSQFLAVSASEVDRLSAISFNEQNKKAKEKNILITSGPTYDRLKLISNRLMSTIKQRSLNRSLLTKMYHFTPRVALLTFAVAHTCHLQAS
jgi:hypothetical protein